MIREGMSFVVARRVRSHHPFFPVRRRIFLLLRATDSACVKSENLADLRQSAHDIDEYLAPP